MHMVTQRITLAVEPGSIVKITPEQYKAANAAVKGALEITKEMTEPPEKKPGVFISAEKFRVCLSRASLAELKDLAEELGVELAEDITKVDAVEDIYKAVV